MARSVDTSNSALLLFTNGVVYVHYVVAGNTGTVGAYTTWRAERGPFSTYFFWDQRRYPGDSGTSFYSSKQWAKFVSPAGAYSTNDTFVNVTGRGYVSCHFATIGFRGANPPEPLPLSTRRTAAFASLTTMKRLRARDVRWS